MRRVFQFLQAVVKHWGVLVTGGFAIGILGIWQGTGHPVRPWVYWIVAIAGLFIAFFEAWNDQVNEKEKALSKITEIQKESKAPPSAADPVLTLLRERQQLEAELQPLLEVEERGVRVIPALKAGKDESDYRRERIERLRRDIEEIGRQLIRQREAQSISSATLPLVPEWQALAPRFEKQSRDARADWNRTGSGKEIWHICGGGHIAELKALCGLAGAMLGKSPKALTGLPDGVLSQGDPVIRWLVFLKESGIGRMDDIMHAIETGKEGETHVHLAGSIKHLSSVSSTACIHCATREI